MEECLPQPPGLTSGELAIRLERVLEMDIPVADCSESDKKRIRSSVREAMDVASWDELYEGLRQARIRRKDDSYLIWRMNQSGDVSDAVATSRIDVNVGNTEELGAAVFRALGID